VGEIVNGRAYVLIWIVKGVHGGNRREKGVAGPHWESRYLGKGGKGRNEFSVC
jgi:hypothetical protein